MRVRRRRLLGLGAAAASTLSCRRGEGWEFFTVDEARLVSAICDQIVPPDQDPGASAAGVPTYIDRQLVRFHKPHQATYRAGLAAINAGSRTRFQRAFTELDHASQLAVLQEAENAPAAKAFFGLIVAHTMQGYYGPPRHGGNRDAVSWRMLGVPFPPVRGRQI